ncbi:MAG: TraR/DksA C4-type zinc finger protein [Parcubacteria group bacterium]|nr:TraR/DksA C4-type zinc finger protein [Parcubacteria group bacterium]
MDQEFLNEMRTRLREEKVRLTETLEHLGVRDQTVRNKEDFDPTFPQYGDTEDDNIAEVSDFANTLDAQNRLEKSLEEVDQALGRIAQGTYGICEQCKKPIEVERLKAFPAARMCLTCEKKR